MKSERSGVRCRESAWDSSSAEPSQAETEDWSCMQVQKYPTRPPGKLFRSMAWVTFQVTSRRRADLIDITERVAEAVAKSGVAEGLCHVFVPHTTAGVTINEGADPDVAADIVSHFTELVPKEAAFEHAEGNSDSHIKAALVGPSCERSEERRVGKEC